MKQVRIFLFLLSVQCFTITFNRKTVLFATSWIWKPAWMRKRKRILTNKICKVCIPNCSLLYILIICYILDTFIDDSTDDQGERAHDQTFPNPSFENDHESLDDMYDDLLTRVTSGRRANEYSLSISDAEEISIALQPCVDDYPIWRVKCRVLYNHYSLYIIFINGALDRR